MGIAKSYSAHLNGLNTEIVTVEVDIGNGLNSFSVVGLGDRAIEESKDRISAAIKNSGFQSPKQKNQKVVISLAPADSRKEGPSFDLAMAMTYLMASEDINFSSEKSIFLGELSLEGKVRRISGLLPILCQLPDLGFDTVFIPKENSKEASLAKGLSIYPIDSLNQLISFIDGSIDLKALEPISKIETRDRDLVDMKTIRGNETAKRGLEIASAGCHNILLSGPPGTGKTMLAHSLCSILPPLSYEQSVEVTGIYSAARILHEDLITDPPFRSPHHTASYPSIVGGGAFPKPGEITLAHRGILFLDEFPEFDKNVIEALRQPLEDKVITISRAKGSISFPAQCMLVASMNPCPCGKGKDNGCTCSMLSINSYKKKISGPIVDRIDLWVNVNKIDYDKLSAKNSDAESSETIKDRIIRARNIQKQRFETFKSRKTFNSEMSAKDIEKMILLDDETRAILAKSARTLELSGRSFHRIIKVARTIADLAGEEQIKKDHILEALQYRQKN